MCFYFRYVGLLSANFVFVAHDITKMTQFVISCCQLVGMQPTITFEQTTNFYKCRKKGYYKRSTAEIFFPPVEFSAVSCQLFSMHICSEGMDGCVMHLSSLDDLSN